MSTNRLIVNALVLPLGLFAATFAAETQNDARRAGDWSVKAPLPRTNSEFGVAEIDGKIYVMVWLSS